MCAFVFSGGHFWPPCVGGFFFLVPDPSIPSAGNETATCALTETTRAYLGAVSTCWWMQSDSARGEGNTGVPF